MHVAGCSFQCWMRSQWSSILATESFQIGASGSDGSEGLTSQSLRLGALQAVVSDEVSRSDRGNGAHLGASCSS